MFAGRLLDDWMLGCGGFGWMVRSDASRSYGSRVTFLQEPG